MGLYGPLTRVALPLTFAVFLKTVRGIIETLAYAGKKSG
jgi:hypothetical protein